MGTGQNLFPGEVFQVSKVIGTETGQRYLLLADMRGWAFTHSSRDGRLLCEPCSFEEAQNYNPDNSMRMAREAQQMFENNPQLLQQVLEDPKLRAVMENSGAFWAAA